MMQLHTALTAVLSSCEKNCTSAQNTSIEENVQKSSVDNGTVIDPLLSVYQYLSINNPLDNNDLSLNSSETLMKKFPTGLKKAMYFLFQIGGATETSRQYGSMGMGMMAMFDPIIGFFLLGTLIVLALAAWLTFILSSARRRKRDIQDELFPGLNLDMTYQVLQCISASEKKYECLKCLVQSKENCFKE